MTSSATALGVSGADYKIADMSLAELGRRDITLAQHEMPAVAALRRRYKGSRPLAGARIIGCLHMTVETAVLMEALHDLGAELRWSSCNIFSTQDHAAAAMVARGISVYAWKGQSPEEGEWCIRQTLTKDGKLWPATMLLDDGGDLTAMVHDEYPELISGLCGLSEQTTTGMMRLWQRHHRGMLQLRAIDVNSSVTKSKNDNKYGCRHSLNDAVKRGTNRLLAGRKALVLGYGDVGKGSAQSLRQEGMITRVAEIDPICAMQACMDGYEVVSPYRGGINTGKSEDLNQELLQDLDLVVTATGNVGVVDGVMLTALKKQCCVCNIGHFDHEIDSAYLKKHYRWEEIRPQVHRVHRSADPEDYLLLLSEGRLVNLGNATGHPSRVMDGSFANQIVAQMHLWDERGKGCPEGGSIEKLPKHLDEHVAALMVEGFGGTLTQLTEEQAAYIDVPQQGPFKSDDYKY